jgi:hypothetical protein
MKAHGEPRKSRAVDLAILGKRKSFLFEVKTSADTTSLYTAIGQLQLHAQALSKIFSGRPLKKVLVIPAAPKAHIQKALEQALGIYILTYRWGAKNAVNLDRTQLAEIKGK